MWADKQMASYGVWTKDQRDTVIHATESAHWDVRYQHFYLQNQDSTLEKFIF